MYVIADIYGTDEHYILVKLKQVCFIYFYCVLIFTTMHCMFPIISKTTITVNKNKKHIYVAFLLKKKKES